MIIRCIPVEHREAQAECDVYIGPNAVYIYSTKSTIVNGQPTEMDEIGYVKHRARRNKWSGTAKVLGISL